MRKLHVSIFGLFAFALFGLGIMGVSANYAADPVSVIVQAYDSKECIVSSTDGPIPVMVLTVYGSSGDMNPGLLTVSDAIPTFDNVHSGADCLKKAIAINDMKVSNPHNARDSISFS